jgi:hypothetical protein
MYNTIVDDNRRLRAGEAFVVGRERRILDDSVHVVDAVNLFLRPGRPWLCSGSKHRRVVQRAGPCAD